MRSVRTRYTEIAMNHPNAVTRRPMITSFALCAHRFAGKVRFVAGIAISLVGAGAFLADQARFI